MANRTPLKLGSQDVKTSACSALSYPSRSGARLSGCSPEAAWEQTSHRTSGQGLESNSGIRVQGSGFRVEGLGFRVEGLGFSLQTATQGILPIAMSPFARARQALQAFTQAPYALHLEPQSATLCFGCFWLLLLAVWAEGFPRLLSCAPRIY